MFSWLTLFLGGGSKFYGFISWQSLMTSSRNVTSRIPRCWCQPTFTKKPWAFLEEIITKIDFTKFAGWNDFGCPQLETHNGLAEVVLNNVCWSKITIWKYFLSLSCSSHKPRGVASKSRYLRNRMILNRCTSFFVVGLTGFKRCPTFFPFENSSRFLEHTPSSPKSMWNTAPKSSQDTLMWASIWG